MMPDFNRLRVLHAVMKTGTVSLAAEQLFVTQSAVSQHIRRLETEMNVSLFTRIQNRLVPTDAARRLFELVDPFVNSLAEALTLLDRSRSVPAGLLRVGAPVEFGAHFMPPLFASFRKQYPEVRFHLTLGRPDVLLPLVEKGELDLAFADLFSTPAAQQRQLALFRIEKIMDESLVLVCSSAYFRANLKTAQTFEVLSTQTYIAYQESAQAVKSWFRHHFGKLPHPLNVAVTLESVQGVAASIKANLGLGLVPHHIVSKEVDAGQLKVIATRKASLKNRISLVRLLDKHPTLAEKQFALHIAQTSLWPKA